MKSFFLIIALIISNEIYSQSSCDFKEYYLDFLAIEIMTFDNENVIILTTKEPPEDFCYYDLFKEKLYLNYIVKSQINYGNYEEDLLKAKNQDQLNAKLIAILKEENQFNELLQEYIDKTLFDKPKDTVTINQMLDYAVKFFTVNVDEEMKYRGKICVSGMQDIEKLHALRLPHIEAFSFSTIFKHLGSDDNDKNMMYQWREAVTNISRTTLGNDTKDLNLRAQGALYILMKNNKHLSDLLIEEYELNKEILPFYLKY